MPACRIRPRAPGTVTTVALAALAVCPTEAAGPLGDPQPERVAAPPHVEEVARVRLVLLPTSVTTPRGKPVRGLQPDDFRLWEEDEPRPIDLFATEEEAPVALAFLLDVSASMGLRDRLEQAKTAVRQLVGTLKAPDRVALIRFAEGRVEWVSGFDEGRAAFLERLAEQRPGGRTALYDALAASPGLVDAGVTGRKAIVLVTDGVDTASQLPRLRATWMARRVGVPIYIVGFIPMREKLLAKRAREALRVIERFASETGGSLFAVHGAGDLDHAARRIQDELRFQYVIGFYPPEIGREGSFRRVRLETVRDRLRVRTRSGYYP